MGRRNLADEVSVVRIVRSLRLFDLHIRTNFGNAEHKQLYRAKRKVAVSYIEPEQSPEDDSDEEQVDMVKPLRRQSTIGSAKKRNQRKSIGPITHLKNGRDIVSNESIHIENVDRSRKADDESSMNSASIHLSELSQIDDDGNRSGSQTTIRKTMTQAVIKKKTVHTKQLSRDKSQSMRKLSDTDDVQQSQGGRKSRNMGWYPNSQRQKKNDI